MNHQLRPPRPASLRRLQSLQALFALAMLLAPSLIAAQTSSPTPAFDDLVEVSEVQLDVLVTDRAGNVVLGLGADDFQVVDSGGAIDLTGVDFYSNRIALDDQPEGRVPKAREALADRYFLFYFEDALQYGQPGTQLVRRQLEAGREAKRWVRDHMLPGDWVAVMSYDVKLQVHADFTQDRAALERAIERASMGKDSDLRWPSRQAARVDGGPSILDDLPRGKALSKATRRPYEAFQVVAEAAGGILGRKSLFYFGIGFGELRSGAGQAIARPDIRFYPPMMQALNDSNVAVYPIDLLASFRHAQTDFLNQLADDTGGRLYDQFTSFVTPIREIADETNGYYLLSYQAEHEAGTTGYREVSVTVRDPNLRVRAREGYRFGD